MSNKVSHVSLTETIRVTTKQESYPIHIGYHLLADARLFQPLVSQKHIFIISHPEIASHYLRTLIKTCIDAGAAKINHCLIPQGDHHKTLTTANQIWNEMLSSHCYRDTTVIGLGGGVIGDLAGFSAACFMRGVKIIHCPTSLLAQIDAAIGGKTGINHPQGKNLIGAFHQPVAVISDLETLQTLPLREYIAGLGELIKYSVALDPALFYWLETHLSQIIVRDEAVLPNAIRWACDIKGKIVSADEKEQGQRLFLNFGHTVAHALESLLDYKQYLHGEAVALGMVVAMHLSLQRGWIQVALWDRFIALLKKAQLPTKLPDAIAVTAILANMKHDKKHSQQILQWILLKELGEPIICMDVTDPELVKALVEIGAKP